MLVLTRKSGDGIRIGEGILVTVLEVRGKQVKIGITAPQDLSVHRDEVYRMIREQNEMASDAGHLGVGDVKDAWLKLIREKGSKKDED